ncbi:hypothetical protein AAE478_003197 [Parahypoxylon ruwenzoriense]
MTTLPSCIVFGSLSTWPSDEELSHIHGRLVKHQNLRAVIEVIQNLPELWNTLVSNDPDLKRLPGATSAEKLAVWVSTGEAIGPSENSEVNQLTMPMTIIRHLCQYFDYIQTLGDDASLHGAVLEQVAKAGGVQGFCAGLLSALAVASSTDRHVVGVNGAALLQLAFAIGTYVDLDTLVSGETSCLAIRWQTTESITTIQALVKKYEQAYISVVKDVQDATITAPTSSVTELIQELSNRTVTVLETGLTGRYHSSVHRNAIEKILQVCQEGTIHFNREITVRSNANSRIITAADAFAAVLQSILLEQSNWHSVMLSVTPGIQDANVPGFILSIGTDAIPMSLSREIKVVKSTGSSKSKKRRYPDHAVAIIGMSCKLPGADSVSEFWQLLSDGKSMLEPVPAQRWPSSSSARGNRAKGQKFWGNFMRDIDGFDHRFFKKSAREAASMDPQQRLLLQATYEALESSGYFSDLDNPRDIGCYIGLCATDYDSNVASHPPNAFSTLGTLRAFLSGKISHFFGWSGPSVTFDTACSSSAVAIHTACQALRNGECSQAIAGGIALFTSPYLYENLSAAHFLSPTGATKPFDAKADGYCRGEGLGLVVLKGLTAAIDDGDDILAVIAGSAVNQNQNCVPIMVPYSSSQGHLYQQVARQASVSPLNVSFVEAHGTGTPVGDPIEMESIRSMFGGPQRPNPLYVSSVKGAIGHLEGASGVAGLIKAILQIENRAVCPQASFQTLNPKIPSLGPDRITIPTTNLRLPNTFISALVNNYGAAGSNAALMIMEPPQKVIQASPDHADLTRYPILISANSPASLSAYCDALRQYTQSKECSLPTLAFHLAKRQNQGLPYAFVTTVTDTRDLRAQLSKQAPSSSGFEQRPNPPPVVLAFGGQVNNCVNLSKRLWQKSTLLRFHLDKCDETLRSLGYPSLYPDIFQSEPITNIVSLHSMVFATQYASAQAWIDSGLVVDALIGHSLGQLTALCVSGALSLEDSLRFVCGRASLMQKYWGPEPGAMLAVEADISTISSINHTLEVACYNGPTSHVMVGDTRAVDLFEQEALKRGLRYKRLNVTHGFHSRFTEPVVPHLDELASGLTLKNAALRVETCSDIQSWTKPTASLLAQHTRAPVFFTQAVRRLADSLGGCTWLEVGSDSSVTGMVRRALSSSEIHRHNFQAMHLNKPTSLDAIVDATVQLWNRGHNVQFWNFHRLQRHEYAFMRLPSYQFEKNRHWLDIVPPPAPQSIQSAIVPTMIQEPSLPPKLVTLTKRTAEAGIFRVDPRCEEYRLLVSGHIVAGSALCPATVYLEMAVKASFELVEKGNQIPLLSVRNLQIESPLGIATDRDLFIQLKPRSGYVSSWNFQVTSRAKNSESIVSHASGNVELQHQSTLSVIQEEFERYERLVEMDKIESLYEDVESESVRGPMVYKVFSRVVEYSDLYRGIRSVAAKNRQIAGTVSIPLGAMHEAIKETMTQPSVMDSFMQVAGLHANAFYPCSDSDVYVFTKLDRLQFGPGFRPDQLNDKQNWQIFSNLTPSQPTDKELANDIFVYDATSKRLVVLILGALFTQVRLNSLSKVLSRVNEGVTEDSRQPIMEERRRTPESPQPIPAVHASHVLEPKTEAVTIKKPAADNSYAILRNISFLVERVAEVPHGQVKGNISLEDLGIDSLMMMEVFSEVSSHFNVDLPIEELESMADVNALVAYLVRQGCGPNGTSSSTSVSDSSDNSSDSGGYSTPSSTVAPPPTPAKIHVGDDILSELARLLQSHLELSSPPGLDANLADLGLDSLLCIELASDIEKLLSVSIDVYQLDEKSTLQDLLRLVGPGPETLSTAAENIVSSQKLVLETSNSDFSTPGPTQRDGSLVNSQQIFEDIRFDFDHFSAQQEFTGFWEKVYPHQARLVHSYINQAFEKLGVNLSLIPAGQSIPTLQVLPKHKHLVRQLHKILVDGGYLNNIGEGSGYTRTAKPLDLGEPQILLNEIIHKFPRHSPEHRLLNVTGSRLAECMTGKIDPLQILFANKANRQLLADVYDYAPMCQAITQHLAAFLSHVFAQAKKGETFHILEVGAGTGGTTRFLVDHFTRRGVSFTYTFTDISSALVSQAKKNFAGYDSMRYMTLDCEKPTPPELLGKYNVVISTNCVHATSNAAAALSNLRPLLSPDGLFALVEFTHGLFWFDLVYGLLDGWWLFSDGRHHALADESFWDTNLRKAGFRHISWTDGTTEEARTLRFICAFNTKPENPSFTPIPRSSLGRRGGVPIETVVWKNIDDVELSADIYYPPDGDQTNKRPVGKPDQLCYNNMRTQEEN